MNKEAVFKIIMDCAFEVHKNLGPGLLESAYAKCLVVELRNRGLLVESEKILPIQYKGTLIDSGYRIDLLVNESIIVELKSVDQLSEIHTAQMLTYLKLSKLQLGLLVNFNTIHLKNGLKRMVLNYDENL